MGPAGRPQVSLPVLLEASVVAASPPGSPPSRAPYEPEEQAGALRCVCRWTYSFRGEAPRGLAQGPSGGHDCSDWS